MLSKQRIKDLEKQGYRIVGDHSAIKVCLWTKKSIRKEDVCYKKTFYGINSHRCVQMTPCLPFCDQRCVWCWRDIDFTFPKWKGEIDNPKDIVDGCIKAQIKYLQGFRGNQKKDKQNFEESLKPIHFAISLSGEPTLYPKLPQLIDELKKRKITSFLVTNGTKPSMLRKLIKHQPTQLYITLPAPDKENYIKCCSPLIKDGWEKINESLLILNKFKRSVIRLTLVKDMNMINPEMYASLIKKYKPMFAECKAYVWVGYSRERLNIENMPLHSEIKEFAKKIAKYSGYKIIDEKKESRVVLLAKNDYKDRKLKF
ncbi:MAG: 4-demethylwyosine synthase TYW1 [Nanoarchaeota archaeon]|nr:4-demethylwyosine synthase TYW1 [Nanoarchaeota archaeon]